MVAFVCRRLLAALPIMFGIVLIVSSMIKLVPGDPVDELAGPYATMEDKQKLRAQLGLDKAFVSQGVQYFSGIFKGDLGKSLISGRPVLQSIAGRFGATFELAIYSLIVALLMSIPLGVFGAVKSKSLVDYLSMTFAVFGVAIPNFWLGPMLILLFSISLGWLPVSERSGFLSYILPCITLGTSLAAVLTRMTRSTVLESLSDDYVRTARSKGLSSMRVLFVHVLKNSALPVLTIVGLQFGVLLSGSIITEKIFDWPGLGTLFIKSIEQRDYPVVQGCVLVFSFTYVVVNLLTDISYAVFDPRIRVKKAD